MTKRIVRILWIVSGWLSFAIGVIGIFLPVLPTTPFMIVAAYCFSHGSERCHRWLLSRPRIGPAIKDWEEARVIRKRAKVLATCLLAVSLISTTVLLQPPVLMAGGFVLLFISVVLFLWSFPHERDGARSEGSPSTP